MQVSLQTCCLQPFKHTYYKQADLLKNVKHHSITSEVKHTPQKISSIPLVRVKVANHAQLRRKLAVRRDKYFYDMSAVGPETIEILQNLVKLGKIHILRKFEFDPYLCEESGITLLSKVVRNIRRLKDISYTIRRTNCEKDAVHTFAPLRKIIGLKNIRLEIPSSLEINDADFLKLMNAISSKCVTLKNYDFNLNGVQKLTEASLTKSLGMLNRMKSLERLSMHVVKRQGLGSEFKCHQVFPLKPLRKIKSFSLVFGVASTGWNDSTSNNCPVVMLSSLANIINPESFSVKFMNALYMEYVVDAMNFSFTKYDKLKHLSIDVIGCELEDSVVIYTIKMMTELMHLERLTFKVTQKASASNLSVDAIIEVVEMISKATQLNRFDIYLRNILLEKNERKALDEKLVGLSGKIKYTHLSRSLHLYR